MDEAHRVREFWFGRLPLSADALNRRLHFWFAGPPSELGRLRDEHIRERFGELLELAEAPQPLYAPFAAASRSAENHRAIIERFGRFPHRNRVLGRENTPAEQEWLLKARVSFGQ